MGAPKVAVEYRLQLTATYLTIRVWVGLASLIVILAVAFAGSTTGRWICFGVVGADLAINVYERKRTHPRAVISLIALTSMLGVLGMILQVPALIASSLVFIIIAATVITTVPQALAIVAYSTAWTVAGLLMSRDGGVPSFFANAVSIAAFGAASLVFVIALTRRLDLLDRLRSRIISSVSHELRSPLTGLHGLATVLKDNYQGLSESETAELIDLLVLESAEATALVEDLLTAVRPTEHLRLNRATVMLDEEIATVVAMLTPAMSKPVTVVDGSGLSAYADSTRFRQILRNLLTNAERYGGPRVEIRAARIGDNAIITVSDDGPGIPPSEQEAVFDEWQGSDVGSQHPESIGLGLTISRRLARAMDGDLTYRYVNGMSSFTITLPIGAPRLASAST
ncbi:MAG: HAMP domain-containing sensor histidine kinase [Acidimicrobiia bacterium]|nr:HAMP domain-containing sensor histidine kinase [Acidimicrobiia bacterium]